MKYKKQNFLAVFCLISFLSSFVFLNLVQAQTTTTDNAEQGFFGKTSNILNVIWNFIKKALNWLKHNILDRVVNWLKTRKPAIEQGIAEEKEEIKQGAGSMFSVFWQKIKNIFDSNTQ